MKVEPLGVVLTMIEMVAEAKRVLSLTEVAVRVIVDAVGTAAGAV